VSEVGQSRRRIQPQPHGKGKSHYRGVVCLSFFKSLRNRLNVRKSESRLQVQKTYKLYIGGKFVRGENGRVVAARDKSGEVVANFSRASKKDFRDAVLAARNAFPNWSKQSAYLRSQIMYRAAEMLEMRRSELQSELTRMNGARESNSEREMTAAIDRLVYYAGWTDKFSQVFGSVNPVASSHFNFTTPEPTGVVVAICPDEPALLGLVSMIAPIILSGNCVIALASPSNALAALTFTEVIATSDLPPGVVNVLAGDRAELAPFFASHMDVNAIVDASGDDKIARELQRGGDYNVKRYFRRNLSSAQWMEATAENPYWILDTVEMKTAWHPIGL
jgi:acyl-CoA reductase-like NAD-dependent aldehyde dehydrogenase